MQVSISKGNDKKLYTLRELEHDVRTKLFIVLGDEKQINVTDFNDWFDMEYAQLIECDEQGIRVDDFKGMVDTGCAIARDYGDFVKILEEIRGASFVDDNELAAFVCAMNDLGIEYDPIIKMLVYSFRF